MFQYNTIHKVIGEGNFVLIVSEGSWNNTSNAFYDLFRMENGKAVEHWDVIQPVPTTGLANDNGMLLGQGCFDFCYFMFRIFLDAK